MTIIITSTSTGDKIAYVVSVKSIREKMKAGILTRKNLQLAALEYIAPSLKRRIPNIMAKEDYTTRFKGLYV